MNEFAVLDVGMSPERHGLRPLALLDDIDLRYPSHDDAWSTWPHSTTTTTTTISREFSSPRSSSGRLLRRAGGRTSSDVQHAASDQIVGTRCATRDQIVGMQNAISGRSVGMRYTTSAPYIVAQRSTFVQSTTRSDASTGCCLHSPTASAPTSLAYPSPSNGERQRFGDQSVASGGRRLEFFDATGRYLSDEYGNQAEQYLRYPLTTTPARHRRNVDLEGVQRHLNAAAALTELVNLNVCRPPVVWPVAVAASALTVFRSPSSTLVEGGTPTRPVIRGTPGSIDAVSYDDARDERHDACDVCRVKAATSTLPLQDDGPQRLCRACFIASTAIASERRRLIAVSAAVRSEKRPLGNELVSMVGRFYRFSNTV